MSNDLVIYELRRNDDVFYVGRTAAPEQRLRDHRKHFGPNICFSALHSYASRLEAIAWEKIWTARHIFAGASLVNRHHCQVVLHPDVLMPYLIELIRIESDYAAGVRSMQGFITQRTAKLCFSPYCPRIPFFLSHAAHDRLRVRGIVHKGIRRFPLEECIWHPDNMVIRTVPMGYIFTPNGPIRYHIPPIPVVDKRLVYQDLWLRRNGA